MHLILYTEINCIINSIRLINSKFMGILDIIILILVISWLGGFAFHIGGGLIHVILVIALIIFVARILGVNM
jgi:hypothetical protein